MTQAGYVYILTNDSFRDDWVKIGKSSRPVDVRSKELDNTAVPLPFKIYATMRTAKYNEVEKLVHKTIDRLTDLRIRQNREFFNVAPDVALDIFRDIASAIDDAVVACYRDNKPIEVDEKHQGNTEAPLALRRRAPFHFSMIGLKVGDELVFKPTGIVVRVAGDRTIEYEGRIYKMSAFVPTFLPEEMQNNSGAYQGPKFFTYHGRTLTELRAEAESRQGINTESLIEEDEK